jgi:hypothetical protein
VTVGSLLTFTARATDPNGDAVSYSLGIGAPAGATINPTTGVFTWTPTTAQGAGVYNITIIASDGRSPALTDSETIRVTVEADSPNPTPGPTVRVVRSGQNYVIQVQDGSRLVRTVTLTGPRFRAVTAWLADIDGDGDLELMVRGKRNGVWFTKAYSLTW